MPRVTDRPVEIEYESLGLADDPALLLVPGLASQLLVYPDELCLGFVDRGFRVIRMDNRDAGLSTILADGASYDFVDMANDVVAVLDDARVGRAIVLGFGLGGFIVRSVAIDHPDRVAGLVSVSSTTGEPHVGQPTDEAYAMLGMPDRDDIEAQIEQEMAGYRIWSNPQWRDEARKREDFERTLARAWKPGASARQVAAWDVHVPRIDELRALDVPTLVIHGDLDPLIDVSGGQRTAELIPGAEYVEIEGFSHELEPQMWAPLISSVTRLASRVEW